MTGGVSKATKGYTTLTTNLATNANFSRGVSVSSHVYDPLRFSPRMDPGAPRTGGKLGKQLTFPGGDPLGSLGSE